VNGRPTILLRNEGVYGGHVTIGVFVGRRPGSRGKAGTVTVSIDDWLGLQAVTYVGEAIEVELGTPLNVLDSKGNGGIG
jgi:hypothetical protein